MLTQNHEADMLLIQHNGRGVLLDTMNALTKLLVGETSGEQYQVCTAFSGFGTRHMN